MLKLMNRDYIDEAEIYHVAGPVGSSVAGFFKKDILMALTNDLHEDCIVLTNSTLFAFCTTYFIKYP